MLEHDVVLILLKERLGGVGHRPGVVVEREGRVAHLRLAETRVLLVRLVELLGERLVVARGEEARLIQARNDPCRKTHTLHARTPSPQPSLKDSGYVFAQYRSASSVHQRRVSLARLPGSSLR